MRKVDRCFVQDIGIANALGQGCSEVFENLVRGDTSGMLMEDDWVLGASTLVGRVRQEPPPMPAGYEIYDCRNNRLLLQALSQIASPVAAALKLTGSTRFGIVLGSSTSGIDSGESAIATLVRNGALPAGFHYAQPEIGAAAPFLARYLGVSGPAYNISTACTSSAKAIASGWNLLRSGLCDAVLVGGVDTLCKLTINGFAALESTTNDLSSPLSRNRRGINLGEGAALMLLTSQPAAVELLGYGESSDAYHMSAPDPNGRGAEAAMREALRAARLDATEVDYLNLHATATPKNDAMEALAVSRVFPEGVSVSGTKPLTGHTLGAAGATEAAFCWLALQGDGRLPPHVWDGVPDPALPALRQTQLGERFARSASRVCMSNSFAFGGNNMCLVLGDAR